MGVREQQIKALRQAGKKREADALAISGSQRATRVHESGRTNGVISGGGTYTVQDGDSYFSIAGDVYGNQRYFEQLQLYNPGLRNLRAGMVIRLPRFNTSREPTVSYAAAANAGLAIPESIASQVGYVNPQVGQDLPPGGTVGQLAPTPYQSPAPPPGAQSGIPDAVLKRAQAPTISPIGGQSYAPGVPMPPGTNPSVGTSAGVVAGLGGLERAVVPGRNASQGILGQIGGALSTVVSDTANALGIQPSSPSQAYTNPPRGPGYSNQPQVFTPQQAEAARLTAQALSGYGFNQQLPSEISNATLAQFPPDVTVALSELGYVENANRTGVVLNDIASAMTAPQTGFGDPYSAGGYFADGANYAALGGYAARMATTSMGRGGQGTGTIYENNGYVTTTGIIEEIYGWRTAW